MEINVHDLKEAIEEAKAITLEGNEKWMPKSEQNMAKITLENFLTTLSVIIKINA